MQPTRIAPFSGVIRGATASHGLPFDLAALSDDDRQPMPSKAQRDRTELQALLPSHQHVAPWELRGPNAEGALHIRLRFAARRLPELNMDSELDFAKTHRTCGWWWCLHPDPSAIPSWGDLFTAVARLRQHDLDPSGWKAAALMNGYLVREQWRAEQKDLDRLHQLLTDFQPSDSVVKNIRQRFLAETTRLIRVSAPVRRKQPGPGRTPDQNVRETLSECSDAGLSSSAAAALLYLFGADVGADRTSLSTIDKCLQDKLRDSPRRPGKSRKRSASS